MRDASRWAVVEQLRDQLAALADPSTSAVVVSESTQGGRLPRSAFVLYDATEAPCPGCSQPVRPLLPAKVADGVIEPSIREHACGAQLPVVYVARFVDELDRS